MSVRESANVDPRAPAIRRRRGGVPIRARRPGSTRTSRPRSCCPSRSSRARTSPTGRGAWQRTLFDAGWLVPGWPPELGGRNATPVEQMIYFEELSKRGISRSANPQGLGIIAPSIRDYGTAEQQERFLLPTLRAEIAWCLGMSEPAAGSDLASLRTRAVLDGDTFVVNGQKVWTSGAHHADWCLCFVRTDLAAPEAQGDQRAHRSTCRPPAWRPARSPSSANPPSSTSTRSSSPTHAVPRENLLGELNGGWPITQGSLAHERAMLWIDYAYSLQRRGRGAPGARRSARVPRVAPSATTSGSATSSPGFAIDAQALMLMGYRGLLEVHEGPVRAGALAAEAVRQRVGPAVPARGGRGARAPTPSTSTSPARRCGATARGPSSTCGRSVERSPAARARSNATSSPSGCSGSHGDDERAAIRGRNPELSAGGERRA